jgi:hypothetical protein
MVCLNFENKYYLSRIEKDIQDLHKKLDKSLEISGRKRTGSYYTPDFIAKYMVEKTISISLLDKLNKLTDKQYLSFDDALNSQSPEISSLLLNQILPDFTVCDPAMGWGVFLLHSFDYLLTIYKRAISVLKDLTKKDVDRYSIQSIISNNLFGTDLSSFSIELAKMKFAEKTIKILKTNEIILPEFNFRRGNSLVGSSFTKKKSSYTRFQEEILTGIPSKNRERVIKWLKGEPSLNWDHVFPGISKRDGFDVVIGNPPYINVKRMNIFGRKAYSKLYETYNPNGDISNVFWERGLDICNSGGLISFITPRYWLEGNDSNKLRRYILLNAEILEIIDFRSNRTLFSSTENKLGVDTSIVFLKKSKPQKSTFDVYFAQDKLSMQSIDKTRLKHVKIQQSNLSDKRWTFEKTPIISQINERADYYLGDDKKYGEFSGICKIGKGCSTGNNRIFKLKQISDLVYVGADNIVIELKQEEKDCLKRLIKNSDITPFYWMMRDEFWIYLKDKDIENYPNIMKYMLNFKERLDKTQRKYGLKYYYDYAAYRSLDLIQNIPKIICPYQSNRNKFALIGPESPPTINETDVISLVIQNRFTQEVGWHFLLSVLNSEIISYYSGIMNKKVYNLYDFRTNQIANFPIMKCEDNTVFLNIVSELIDIKKPNIPPEDIYRYEQDYQRILDYLVYETYFRESLSSQLLDVVKENLASLTTKETSTERKVIDEIKKIEAHKNVQQIRKALGKALN